MGQRTNAKQAASTVTGRRRSRQGRVALFVPGASKCNGHTPTGGKSDEAETRLAMLVGAASYAWGGRPNLEWQWSAHHGQDTWRRIVQMLD
jgi:hypothetical protein